MRQQWFVGRTYRSLRPSPDHGLWICRARSLADRPQKCHPRSNFVCSTYFRRRISKPKDKSIEKVSCHIGRLLKPLWIDWYIPTSIYHSERVQRKSGSYRSWTRSILRAVDLICDKHFSDKLYRFGRRVSYNILDIFSATVSIISEPVQILYGFQFSNKHRKIWLDC